MKTTVFYEALIWSFLLVAMFYLGFHFGKRQALDIFPSCLYIQRPSMNDIKPLGYDNHEGVDASFSLIEGGGYYISLEKWKRQ